MAVTPFAIQIDATIMIQTRICYQTFQKQQQLKIQQSRLLRIMWTWFSLVLWSLLLYFKEVKTSKHLIIFKWINSIYKNGWIMIVGKIHPIQNTGKSLSEALIFASTNPQYDDRLPLNYLLVQYMKITRSEYVVYTNCFWFDIQNNLSTQYVLSLEFSCSELVIQWTICVILWVSWCKNKCFWKRFTCT